MAAANVSFSSPSKAQQLYATSRHTSRTSYGSFLLGARRSPPSRSAQHPHLKLFRQKGVMLVLFWVFCGLLVFNAISNDATMEQNLLNSLHISPLSIFIMCAMFYPLLGWLADVHLGRFRAIQWSLRFMWLVSILFCLFLILLQVFYTGKHSEELRRASKMVLYFLFSLGFGGFQANIIQFGSDQLSTASSFEIVTFLRCFMWVWFLCGVVHSLLQTCFCVDYEALSKLLIPSLLTLALISDSLCSHWLVKEKTAHNPFTLICKVLYYAAKNKYPRLTSAFAYYNGRVCSRIEYAKQKYGGPFTTQQVEDVKTFFRIVVCIVAGGVFTGFFMAMFPVYGKIQNSLDKGRSVLSSASENCSHLVLEGCIQRVMVHYVGHCIMVVVLPLYHFLLYPLFHRYCCKVYILIKVALGFLAILLSFALCTVIVFVANSRPDSNSDECFLENQTQTWLDLGAYPVKFWWMAIPYMLLSVCQFFLISATAEFLSAQSPYSMKGFLFGSVYGFAGFFTIVGYGITRVLAKISMKWLSKAVYGCMSWYLFMHLLLLCFLFAVILCAIKFYKRRVRDYEDRLSSVNLPHKA